MATLEEIVVQLTAETSGLRAEMQAASKSVEGATSKMDKAIEEFSKNSSKNTSFFQQTMATMTGFLASQAVTGAIGLLTDGVKALASELVDAGQEAMAEEQAFTRLATSLRLSGNYSKEAADGLVTFSNEMEGLAGVGVDVIAGNLAIMSSLTRLNSEGLKKALEQEHGRKTLTEEQIKSRQALREMKAPGQPAGVVAPVNPQHGYQFKQGAVPPTFHLNPFNVFEGINKAKED